MDLQDYDGMRDRVERGEIVALATAVDGEGVEQLVGVAGEISEENWEYLRQGGEPAAAQFALKAIMQARSYYEIRP